MDQKAKFGLLALGAALLFGSQCGFSARAADEHAHVARPAGREVLDDRYNHGHYYPAIGASVRVLTAGYRP